jgi:hypothetical protein
MQKRICTSSLHDKGNNNDLTKSQHESGSVLLTIAQAVAPRILVSGREVIQPYLSENRLWHRAVIFCGRSEQLRRIELSNIPSTG